MYHENGGALAYLDYKHGYRHGTFLIWDERQRPLALEQFKLGKRNGLRILYGVTDPDGREVEPWVVQQWRRDRVQSTIVLGAGGQHHAVTASDLKRSPDDGDIALALAELNAFQKRFDAGENWLKREIVWPRRFDHAKIRFRKARRKAYKKSLEPPSIHVLTVPDFRSLITRRDGSSGPVRYGRVSVQKLKR